MKISIKLRNFIIIVIIIFQCLGYTKIVIAQSNNFVNSNTDFLRSKSLEPIEQNKVGLINNYMSFFSSKYCIPKKILQSLTHFLSEYHQFDNSKKPLINYSNNSIGIMQVPVNDLESKHEYMLLGNRKPNPEFSFEKADIVSQCIIEIGKEKVDIDRLKIDFKYDIEIACKKILYFKYQLGFNELPETDLNIWRNVIKEYSPEFASMFKKHLDNFDLLYEPFEGVYLNVPLFRQQHEELWSDKPMEPGPCTIAEAGCWIVSQCMVMDYYYQEITNPFEYNKWLSDPNIQGYTNESGYVWYKAKSYLDDKGFKNFTEEITRFDDKVLDHIDSHLFSGHPVIIKCDYGPYNSHFLVIVGKNTSTEEGEYYMNDPYNYNQQSFNYYIGMDIEFTGFVMFLYDIHNPSTNITYCDRGFRTTENWVNWEGVLGQGINSYNRHYFFTEAISSSNPDNYALWNVFSLPESGYYDVQVFIPSTVPNRSQQAKYQIHYIDVNGQGHDIERIINQNLFSDEWVTLGNPIYFNSDYTENEIRLNDNTGENDKKIVFDAIRFVSEDGTDETRWHPVGSLVRIAYDPKDYVITKDGKRWIKNNETFNAYGYKWDNIIIISSKELNNYPDAGILDDPNYKPVLIKEAINPEVYLLDNSIKRHIWSDKVFESWGFDWGEINVIPDASIYPTGEPVIFRDGTLLKTESSNKVYVVESGLARHISSEQVFNDLGYSWENIITIPDNEIDDWVHGIGYSITDATLLTIPSFDLPDPLPFLQDLPSFINAGSTVPIIWEVQNQATAQSIDLYLTYDLWASSEEITQSSLSKSDYTLNKSSIVSNNVKDNMQISNSQFNWQVPSVETDKAEIRVVAYNDLGNAGHDYSVTFSISGTLPTPETPHLLDPGLYSPDGHFTINWDNVPNATSYIIWEDDNTNFNSPTEYTQSQSQFVASSYANGFYYYKARSVNDNVESEWSNMVDMEVRINSAPLVPSNPTPNHGASGVARQPTVSWQGGDPDGDDVVYRVMKGETETSQSWITNDLTTTSWTFNETLQPNSTIYWRIWAKDSKGLVTEGPVWVFTTVYLFPDLTAIDGVVDDNTPEVGQQLQLDYDVRNVGNMDVTKQGLVAKYYISNTQGMCENEIRWEVIQGNISAGNEVHVQTAIQVPSMILGQAYLDIFINKENNPQEDILDNNIFSIPIVTQDTEAPQLTLYYPPQIPFYKTLNECSIVWDAQDNSGIDHFDFYYSLDNGATWTIIIEGYVTNTNGYEWMIPDGAVTTTARVKIIATDSQGHAATAISDPFKIVDGRGTMVTVKSPNGGESWDLESTHEITWDASSPNEIRCFYVGVIKNGEFDYLDYALPGDSRSYSWTLPSAGASDNVLIKVKSEDEFGTITEDVSDGYFTISDPFGPPDSPWHVPEAITELPDLSYAYLTQTHSLPAIAVDTNGDLHVAYVWSVDDWRDGLGQTHYYENQIYYRQQLNGNWQEPVQVTDYPLFTTTTGSTEGYYSNKHLHMVIDGNDIPHLVWIRWAQDLEWPNYDDDVFYCYFNGVLWSDPENLSAEVTTDPQSRTDVTDIVVDSQNNIHVVWMENIWQGSKNMYHNIKINGSWQSAEVIEPYPWYFFDLAADDQGNVHMITAEMADIFHKVYDGNSWSSVSLQSDASKEYQDCRLKKGGGNTLHAAFRWHYYDSNLSQWMSTIDYFFWNGTSWSNSESIGNFIDYTNNKEIGLAITSSNLPVFVWVDVDRSVNPHIYTMYSQQKTDAGLSPILRLSDRITYIDYSKASVDAACNMLENVHVVWKGRPEGEEEIIYNWASTTQDVVPPTVTVTSPTAEHVSSIAAQETIGWIADDDNGIISLNISFSEDGGQTFSTVATGVQNDGEYLWNVPVVLTDSAVVSVTAFDIQGNEGIGFSPRFRISDTTPPTVTILKPNGGEYLQGGATAAIEWSANDNFYIKLISLEYSLDGGAIFHLISDNEINDGQANWPVPTSDSDNALVRIIVCDSLNNTSFDVSDSEFSIITGNNPPYAAYAPVPANLAEHATLSPILNWKSGDPDGDVLTFDIVLDQNSPPTIKIVESLTETSFEVTNLQSNKTYYWQVISNDGIATTPGSVWQFKTGDAAIGAPSNLVVTSIDLTGAALEWQDNSNNESLFVIEGKTDDNYNILASVSENQMNVAILNLTPNTEYTFRSFATNGITNSGYSNEVVATTGNRPPTAPSNPSPAMSASGQPIDLSLNWIGGDPDIGDVAMYDVYFGTSTLPPYLAGDVQATTYTLQTLQYNTFYFWRIISRDNHGLQTNGPLWSFSTCAEPLPADPLNLQAQPPNSAAIALNWQDQSTNEIGFKLGRKLEGTDDFTQIAVIQQDQTDYTDQNGLAGDAIYVYGIRAYNSSGNSGYSNEVQIVAPRVSYYDFPITDGAWYMVSLPLTPFDNLISNIFPPALDGKGWVWDGNDYTSIQNVGPQDAFWLPVPDSWFGDVAGYGVSEYTVHFPGSGWYMISGVVDPVDFTDPNDSPDGSVISPAFRYDPYSNSYYQTDVIEPKHGHWVAVFQACDLNVGGDPLEPTLGKPSFAELNKVTFFSNHGEGPPALPNLDWETGELIEKIPRAFALYQNYPNPFNSMTTIAFDLPMDTHVEIVIYNIMGQNVVTLLDKDFSAGSHEVLWHGRNGMSQPVSSGIYLCRIEAGEFRELKKLVLVR